MLQSALRRKLLPHVKLLPHGFHTSAIRCNTQWAPPEIVEQVALRSHELHSVFQHVHEYTALPWIFSIPLATVLVRSLVTPFRYYFALCRRDQRLAIPKLILASKVIEKQKEVKLAAKQESREEIEKWTERQWIRRRDVIDVEFPHARPSGLVSTSTNFDAANIGAVAVVFVNTQTLFAINFNHPDLFPDDLIGNLSAPLSVLFVYLGIFNTLYYHGGLSPLVRRSDKLTLADFNVFNWSRSESKFMVIVLSVILAGLHLAVSPAVVIVSVLSNSTYTLFEAQLLKMLVPMPPLFDNQPRPALQATYRPRKVK